MSTGDPTSTRESGRPARVDTLTDDGATRAAVHAGRVPDFVGRFAVLRELGAGAMGVVYSGYDEDLDRRVAIKVLGERGKSDAQRMLREAQALARLSHPNVVQIYEVGRREAEVYIAMEFVQGQTVRQWLTEGSRAPTEILEVFVQAARGLQAAHEAGLVHRDFKPDNVIVGGDGRVRVLDFGIARVSESVDEVDPDVIDLERSVDRIDTSEKLTRTGQFMGTPAYMSPEQFRGTQVDARSDQFSFCVALYEALFGRRPFDHSSVAALLNSVTEGEVGETPADPRIPAPARDALLRGLRPQPDQRWPSMSGLIDALVPDPGRSSTRRSLWAAGAIAAGATAAFLLLRNDGPAPCSGAEAAIAEVWDSALRDRVAALADAPVEHDAWGAASASIDAWTRRWKDGFTGACRANLRGEHSDRVLDLRMRCLGRRKLELGAMLEVMAEAPDEALRHAPDAVAGLGAPELCDDLDRLQRQVAGPEDPQQAARVETWREELAHARALYQAGVAERAKRESDRLAAAASEIGYAPVVAEALALQGRVAEMRGEDEEAGRLLEDAYYEAVASRHWEAETRIAIDLFANLGMQRRRFDEAEAWHRQARALVQRDGDNVEAHAALLTVLGGIREQQDRLEEAEEALSEALRFRSALDDVSNIAPVHNALGLVHDRMGRHVDAQADYERAIEIWTKVGGPTHPQVADGYNNLGTLQLHRRRFDEARAAYERALEIRRVVFGPDSPRIGRSLNNLGTVAEREGDLATAIAHFEAAVANFEAAYGPDHPALAIPLNNLGDAALAQGDPARAEPHFARALKIDEAALGPDHRDLSYELIGLGRSALGQGEPRRALPHLQRALSLRQRHAFGPHDIARARFHLAAAQWDVGRRRDATVSVETALTEAADNEALVRDIESWKSGTIAQ